VGRPLAALLANDGARVFSVDIETIQVRPFPLFSAFHCTDVPTGVHEAPTVGGRRGAALPSAPRRARVRANAGAVPRGVGRRCVRGAQRGVQGADCMAEGRVCLRERRGGQELRGERP
jgi:hypothetical protein